MFIIRKYIVGNKLFCFMLVTMSRASMWAHHRGDAIRTHHNAGNMDKMVKGIYCLYCRFLQGYDDEVIMFGLPLKLIKRTIGYKINCGLLWAPWEDLISERIPRLRCPHVTPHHTGADTDTGPVVTWAGAPWSQHTMSHSPGLRLRDPVNWRQLDFIRPEPGQHWVNRS